MSSSNRDLAEQSLSELPKITRLPETFPRSSSQVKVEAVLGPRGSVEEALLKHALDTETDDPHKNPIFELLVLGEHDVPGLLAYGLYKQNKRDWLIAFQASNSRTPDAAELAAFILSERIPRRIATYRRIAEDMLSRDGYRLNGAKTGIFNGSLKAANDATGVKSPLNDASKRAQTLRYIFGMLALVIAMAVLFRLAGGWLFGTPGR
jgi:hypothetical protein